MELFEHQKKGIEFLKSAKKAILADEMGLGKTRQAIIAAGETALGVLVVCPASLKINWRREIKMVYPDQRVEIVNTTDVIARPQEVKWFVINYDILEKKMEYIDFLIEQKIIDCLILDEAHYIKGKSVRAAAVVGGFIKKDTGRIKMPGIASKMSQVYALTGTPLLNRPIELFNLLKAINHPLGNNRTKFGKRYCGAFMQMVYTKRGMIRFMNEQGAENLDELRTLMEESLLRRKKKEVLDLPEKLISVVECDLSADWQKKYDRAWEAYLEFLRENPIPEKNLDNIIMARHLVEIQKLKQVCSQSKIDRMTFDIERAIDGGEKVIVFSQYTETIRQIEEAVSKLKFDTGKDTFGKPTMKAVKSVVLTGDLKMDKRQDAVDDFQNNDEVKVFIANIKAGGVGLTLTKATIVMFADMDWSPEIHRQAEDRTHRIGQNEMVNVYYYVATGTVEEDIIEILNSKKSVMDQILEGRDIEQGSMQEAFLKRLKEKTANR